MDYKNPTQYKTLPCFNFLSTGHCSFEHKCFFIHDERVRHNKVFNRKQISDRKNAPMSEEGYMLIYWPQMYHTSRDYFPETVCNDVVVNHIWKRFIEDLHLFRIPVVHSTYICNFKGEI